MSTQDDGPAATPEPTPIPPQNRRRFPIWSVVVAGICLIAIVALRATVAETDEAIINMVTFGLLVTVGITFLIFIARQLSGRGLLVGLPFLAAAVLIVAAASLLRIEGVSGGLVPELKWRWTQTPDQLLGKAAPKGAPGPVDLSSTTPHDFPQFLGPNRDGKLSGIQLASDWLAKPPELLWRQPIGAGWSSFAIVNGYAVTMEQRREEELVTCYEVATGELRWVHATETRHETIPGDVGPRSTPTISNGRVYSLGANGNLCCLDGTDGSVIWQIDLFQQYGTSIEEDLKVVAWGRSASPLVVDGKVIVPVGGDVAGQPVTLAAFDAENGTELWKAGKRQISYASPIIADVLDERQVVSVNEGTVTGHDPATGEIRWEHAWPGKSESNASVSQPHVVAGDHLFLSKGYGQGAALLKFQKTGGKFQLEQLHHDARVMKTKFSNVVVLQDFVYGLSDGLLECIELQTLARRWKARSRFGHGQLLAVGQVLLIQAESGEVSLVEANPEGFSELSRFEAITGKTWNNPALFGNLLLVRNGEQAACYQLPLEL